MDMTNFASTTPDKRQTLRFFRLLPNGTVEQKLVVTGATITVPWEKLSKEGWVTEFAWRLIEKQIKKKLPAASAAAPSEAELNALAGRG